MHERVVVLDAVLDVVGLTDGVASPDGVTDSDDLPDGVGDGDDATTPITKKPALFADPGDTSVVHAAPAPVANDENDSTPQFVPGGAVNGYVDTAADTDTTIA